jgi:hypothetical protein
MATAKTVLPPNSTLTGGTGGRSGAARAGASQAGEAPEPVTRETFQRLPKAVREWYQSWINVGGKMPTELAARCLVNDFWFCKFSRGGSKGVDGWKAGTQGRVISRRYHADIRGGGMRMILRRGGACE